MGRALIGRLVNSGRIQNKIGTTEKSGNADLNIDFDLDFDLDTLIAELAATGSLTASEDSGDEYPLPEQ